MRRQGGFTVVEVLVAMAVLGIVAVGAMTMIEVVMRQGRGVLDRTEAAQRGRLVLDQITRQVRSQVCLDETTKGLVSGKANMLTFYADLSPTGASPVRRRLEYDGSSREIVEQTYQANGTTRTVLLDNVVPSKDPEVPEEPPPFFTYWAYSDVAGSAGTLVRIPNEPTTAQLARVSMIKVNFAVRPHGATDNRFSTALSDQIALRNADPNATNNDPTCK